MEKCFHLSNVKRMIRVDVKDYTLNGCRCSCTTIGVYAIDAPLFAHTEHLMNVFKKGPRPSNSITTSLSSSPGTAVK